jgi:hypothetical protein
MSGLCPRVLAGVGPLVAGNRPIRFRHCSFSAGYRTSAGPSALRGAKACVQRDHLAAMPSISSIELERTPSWMTREISAVLNNLQSSAARWRFSTCLKNPCADIGLARRWCRRPLSCPSSLRDFLCSLSRSCPLVGSLERTQSLHTSGEYSLGFHIKFRVQFGQHLDRDL